MSKNKRLLHDRIGRRLLKRVLFFSLLLTVLFTSFQALMDYHKRMDRIAEIMEQVGHTQTKSIVEAMWNYDERELVLLLEGVLHFPYLRYASIHGEDGLVAEAGAKSQRDIITREHPLIREEQGRSIQLGTLYLQASSAEVIHEVINRVLLIFLFQAMTVSIIASLLFMLFNRMVTRHLWVAANYFRDFDISEQGTPLQLDKIHSSDEIDTLVDAFNLMREKLSVAYHQQLLDQQRIQESEERYRTLFNNDYVVMLVIDPETARIVDANPAAVSFYGYRYGDLLKLRITDINTLSAEQVRAEMARVRASHGDHFKFRHRLANGEIRDVEVYSGPITIGKRALLYSIIHDETERKRAENELSDKHEELREAAGRIEQSRNMLKLILESIPVRVFWKDRVHRYLGCNTLFACDAGFSRPDELLGMDDFAMSWRDDAELYRADDRQVMESGLPKKNILEQLTTPTGARLWLNTSKVPLRTPGGEVFGVLGVYDDITERKRTEEEVQRLHRLLSNIINSMPSILVAVDVEGKITQWSREAEKATGIKAPEAVDRQLSTVFPYLAAKMSKVLDAIRLRQVQAELQLSRKAEGEIRYHDLTVYPLASNGVEGAVIRLDDVTERVRMEEMLVQSEKMLSVGGLAAGLAHEINNPLAGIIQNAQVIHNRLTTGLPRNVRVAAECGTTMDVIHEYVKKREILPMLSAIIEAGRRAAAIVENMLSFSRKGESRFVPHNLAELLDRTIHLAESDYDMKKKYDFRQISILREYEPGMPPVPCEATNIQQVVLNLLKNGAQAMAGMKDRAAQFTIRLYTEGAMACIEVEDNGPGMEQAIRKRVFEPFFTTKEVGAGTGLGLSVAYFIIAENHGGSIEVESEPGRGARFIIHLPLERAESK